jgi:hypothetical protein
MPGIGGGHYVAARVRVQARHMRVAFQATRAARDPAECAKLAAKGDSPSTPGEHFFADMRRITLEGYYTSEIGLRQELGYQGGHGRAGFSGCRRVSFSYKKTEFA